MITIGLSENITETNRVTFHWRGMSISLEAIESYKGEKSLYVMVENAKFVGLPLGGRWVKWIISKEAMESGDAGASTTSSGSAEPAT